jgi:putative DNA primase/helicase
VTEQANETLRADGTAAFDVANRDSDRANGEEIAARFSGELLWSPGMGWLTYDGRRWTEDSVKQRVLMAGGIADALRDRSVMEDDETLERRVRRLESARGLTGALTFAEPLLAREVTQFDVDPLLLNCPNGVLNLRSGKLERHSPEQWLTRLCPTEYDPDARDDVWEKVVREALDDDEDRMRVLARFAGYTLTGYTSEKKFLVPHGPTNTGKSTVSEPIYRMLGDVASGGYATVWDAEVVQADTRVNRNEKLAKARGCRLVLVGELVKGARMADNFVKQFTGGDTMDARALYQASYSYRPQAKLWMATNYVPMSADPALHGRLLLIPFEHAPPRIDPKIKKHLDESEDAHRAILAWAVRGCQSWIRGQGLGTTPWLQDAVAKYALTSDATLDFIHDMLIAVDEWDMAANTDEMWQAYNLVWAPENVQRPLKRRVFERALEEHGLQRKRGTHGVGPTRWAGFRIRGTNDG